MPTSTPNERSSSCAHCTIRSIVGVTTSVGRPTFSMHRNAANVLPVPVGMTTTPRRVLSQAVERRVLVVARRALVVQLPAGRLGGPAAGRVLVGSLLANQLLDDRAVMSALGAVRGGSRVEQHAGQRLEVEPVRPAGDDDGAAIVAQLDRASLMPGL